MVFGATNLVTLCDQIRSNRHSRETRRRTKTGTNSEL
jgi:hypothetical protein